MRSPKCCFEFFRIFRRKFSRYENSKLRIFGLSNIRILKTFFKEKISAFEILKSRLSQYLRYFVLKKAQKSILKRSGSLKVKRISFVIINVVGGACGELVSRGTSRAGRSRRSHLILKRLRRCYPRLSRRRHPPSKQPEFR